MLILLFLILLKKIAIEAVVYSASKKDKATGILSEGVDILKKLYQSKNHNRYGA